MSVKEGNRGALGQTRQDAPLRVAALTAGAGAPVADFAGRVLEVHGRAALITFGPNRLLTLLAPALGAMPGGIVLGVPPEFRFTGLLVPGAPAAARGGVLRIGAGRLTVDLRGARAWRSRLAASRVEGRRPAVAGAWQAVRAAVSAPLPASLTVAVGSLQAALHGGNPDELTAAMARLIGSGEGRTPLGDDYLVGVMAALWAGADPGFVAAAGARLRNLAHGTGRVSRHYLDAAVAGEVSERLADVAAAIAAGADAAALAPLVAAACAIGHSSGAAGLRGLVDGLAAVQPDVASAR